MEYKVFIEKYGNAIEEVSNYNEENNSVFSIFGMTHYEIRHSFFLKWLLSKDKFREEFYKLCGIEPDKISKEKPEIRREEAFNEVTSDCRNVYFKIYQTSDGSVAIYRIHSDEETKKAEKPKGFSMKIDDFMPDEREDTIYGNVTAETQNDSYYAFIRKDGEGTIERVPDVKKDNKAFYRIKADGNRENLYLFPKGKNKEDVQTKNNRRFIDLNIIGTDYTVTIENKIEAGEHDYQCIAYRNYMLANKDYKNKPNHFFVFLAKKVPEDFDEKNGSCDLERGVYPGYKLVKYEAIKNLLENLLNENENSTANKIFEQELIKQYIALIENWDKMDDQLYEIIEKNKIDLEPFSTSKNFNELRYSLTLNESELNFIEYARKYYLKLKDRFDNQIHGALNEMIQDDWTIKDDYGRSSYAYTIPISLSILSGEKKCQFLKEKYPLKWAKLVNAEKKVPNTEGNKEIKKINNDKKCIDPNKMLFQTVDYRAPREDINNPSIAIYSGIYSKQLIRKLKEGKMTESLKKLAEKGWKAELSFTRTDDSNTPSHSETYLINKEKWHLFKDLSSQAWLDEENCGKLRAGNLFVKEKLKSLLTMKEKGLFDVKGALESIIYEFFIMDQKGMAKSAKKIKEFLEDTGSSESFKEYIKNVPVFKDEDSDELRSITESCLEKKLFDGEQDTWEQIKCAVWFDEFEKWCSEQGKSGEPVFKELYKTKNVGNIDDVITDTKLAEFIKGILKPPKNEKKKEEIAEEDTDTEEDTDGEGSEDRKKERGNLLSSLITKLVYRRNRKVTIGWELTLIWELTSTEQQKLIEEIYCRTLDGVGVFGEEYKTWFMEQVFKTPKKLGFQYEAESSRSLKIYADVTENQS